MLVGDQFLKDILDRIEQFEEETGIEVRCIKINRTGNVNGLGYPRQKTVIQGISMEAS